MRRLFLGPKAYYAGTYYAAVAVYVAIQAYRYFELNTHSTGIYSDAALVLSILAVFVGAGALRYLAGEWRQARDGARTSPPRPSVGKLCWYGGVLVLVGARIVLDYRRNHNSIGAESIASYAWLLASAGIGLFTLRDILAAASARRETGAVPDGRTLGKYELRGLLGRGAMGTVHDGWDPINARRVAIKTIPLPSVRDRETEALLARFRREAQAAGRLNHQNIVSVFDYGETGELAYIVMEFVDGRPLSAVLEDGKPLALAETIGLMEDLLSGLQYSHEHGVVHRDVKPANVMLTRDGRAKIADFGIARIESSTITQVGEVLGTAAYMSPEQFLGEPVDARTDLYSAGVLFYKLLTGERPFEGSMTAIMQQVLTSEPPAPSRISAAVPAALDAVVRRAMAKRPNDRFASAGAFARAIADARARADADGTVLAAASAQAR